MPHLVFSLKTTDIFGLPNIINGLTIDNNYQLSITIIRSEIAKKTILFTYIYKDTVIPINMMLQIYSGMWVCVDAHWHVYVYAHMSMYLYV